jgi:adenine/guanine phosphoribosyltransferase-like PRPP-binding protein
MFSAFDGRWGPPAGGLIIVAAAAMLLSVLLARWKYVPKENYGPAVEF